MLAEMAVELDEFKCAAGGSVTEVAAGWLPRNIRVHPAISG
jgi:hypothetical protein